MQNNEKPNPSQSSRNENHQEDDKILGGNSVAIRGEIIENTPTVPHVEVTFLTNAAPNLLFSTKSDDSQAGKKTFVSGADWFDTKLKPILNAIRDDDPFADQLLYDIEQSIYNLGGIYKQELSELKFALETKLSNFNASLHLNDNMHLATYKIVFQNRLAYDLLWALKELDTVLYYLYFCDKYAVLPAREIADKRTKLRKQYRQTLQMINRWKSTSITRDDVAHNTQRVTKTFEINSEIKLTKEVLLLEVRADCAPNIRTRRGNNLDKITHSKIVELYC